MVYNTDPEIAQYERRFRDMLFQGRVPDPFQGVHSMGWLSEDDWLGMDSVGLSNHFHEVIAGDRYIVVDGAFHAVWNHPKYQPVSVAHDDLWTGSLSDSQVLVRRNAQDCIT